MLALLGLLAGALVAALLRPEVPPELARYVAMGVVAAIDAAVGGIRATLDRTFDDRTFVLAFTLNAIAAAGLVWVGDQFGIDLTTAIVVVFGIRIFQNLAAVRRRVLGG